MTLSGGDFHEKLSCFADGGGAIDGGFQWPSYPSSYPIVERLSRRCGFI